VTHNLAGADLRKKPLPPNLDHSIPKVRMKQFDRGTNNGSKDISHIGQFGEHDVVAIIDKTEKV
jgi:hypothetical protein